MFITILLTQAMILRNINTMYLSCCIIMFNLNVQLRICNCNCDPQTVLETPNKCQLLINCLSCAIFSTSNELRFCVKYYKYNFLFELLYHLIPTNNSEVQDTLIMVLLLLVHSFVKWRVIVPFAIPTTISLGRKISGFPLNSIFFALSCIHPLFLF